MNNAYRIFFVAAAIGLCAGGFARAQSTSTYRIGPEDLLSITFWSGDQPLTELAQQVTVRQDSMVALPLIGDIRLAGLTAEEAGERIEDRISRYNLKRTVSQVLVQVVGFMSRRVVVSGEVANASVYAFEVVPNLWDVIRRAGGATAMADLSRVRVISPAGVAEVVDLAQILATGRGDQLPPLEPGTTIDVPTKRVPTETYKQVMADREPIVHVTGEVRSPGVVSVERGLTLYDAIAQAGGFSANANPKHVTVISKGVEGPVSHEIDLRPDSDARGGMNYELQYEDMVIVEARGRGFGELVGNISIVVSLVSSITTLIVVLER